MEVTNIESPIMNWSGKGTWIDKDYLEEALKNHVVNNLTEQSATKALAANQGVVLDNKDVGIMGGRDGKFPLTAATKGNIYLLESTQKYYICINDYDGIQISVPNANFEELSVYTNRSKLDNLWKKEIVYTDSNFTIIDVGIGYVITVDQDIRVPAKKIVDFNLNINLNLKVSYHFPTSSTTVAKGGYGSSDLTMKVSNSIISFFNQSPLINIDLYTIPTIKFIPKY